MNGKDLLNALNHVDESLIYEAEEKKHNKPLMKYFVSIAASFAILFGAVSMWTHYQGNNPIDPNGHIPVVTSDEYAHSDLKYTLYFNQVVGQTADRLYIEGHFWEELTALQIEKVLPSIAKKYKINGKVNYSYSEGVISIFSVDSSFMVDNKVFHVTIAPDEIAKCYLIDGEPILSEIEGVVIEAGIFIDDINNQRYIYYADFKIEDVAYYVEYVGDNDDADRFEQVVADVILNGKVDLSVFDDPTVPDLRNDTLTEKAVYAETDFGAYLPNVPDGYLFNGATRFTNQVSNYLFASWSHGYADISITLTKLNEQDKERMVSLKDTDLYDMSLYHIPWSESMPRDKAHIIENPIFNIEELTLDILNMRSYTRGETNDPSGNSMSMRFTVLYDDILVEVKTEGVSPEYLYNELLKLPRK